MESPWYARELTRCEVDQSPRFDLTEMPGVVWPVPNGMTVFDVASNGRAESTVTGQKLATDVAHPKTSAQLERVSRHVVASDVRRMIVELLLAKEMDVGGRRAKKQDAALVLDAGQCADRGGMKS